MKKILLLLLIIALPISGLASFSDVNQETDYYNSIQWMAENGVIEGYGDGNFGPEVCVKRVELLKMLFLSAETELIEGSGEEFPDVNYSSWYGPYVSTAFANGSIEGYPDGTFQPSNCVNRVEAIKMARSEFGINTPEYSGDFPYLDVNKNGWYFDNLMSSINNNLLGMKHVEDTEEEGIRKLMFYPGNSMSRAEVAEMLYRMKAVQDNAADRFEDSLLPNIIESRELPGLTGAFLLKNESDISLLDEATGEIALILDGEYELLNHDYDVYDSKTIFVGKDGLSYAYSLESEELIELDIPEMEEGHYLSVYKSFSSEDEFILGLIDTIEAIGMYGYEVVDTNYFGSRLD